MSRTTIAPLPYDWDDLPATRWGSEENGTIGVVQDMEELRLDGVERVELAVELLVLWFLQCCCRQRGEVNQVGVGRSLLWHLDVAKRNGMEDLHSHPCVGHNPDEVLAW